MIYIVLILAVLLGVAFESFFFSTMLLGAGLICIGFIAALIKGVWEAIKEIRQKKNLEQKSYQKVTDDFAKDSPLHKEKVRNNGNLNSDKINSKLLFLIKALPFMC